jgi:ketosteroid isomerase-like protein
MKLVTLLATVALVALGAIGAPAQDAQAEKTIIANERAINEAVAKGNVAAFKEHVSADGWAVDSMMGRMAVADFLEQFEEMVKHMKMTSWDITDSKIQWVDGNTAIHTFKWTGSGTYQGQPIPSPVWTSTVWTKKNGKWTAVFHQESGSMPEPTSTPVPQR